MHNLLVFVLTSAEFAIFMHSLVQNLLILCIFTSAQFASIFFTSAEFACFINSHSAEFACAFTSAEFASFFFSNAKFADFMH